MNANASSFKEKEILNAGGYTKHKNCSSLWRKLTKLSDEDTVDHRDSPEQRRYLAKIPSGMNLGGLCVMSLQNSVLYLHRLKLSDDTFFQLKDLHNDIDNMVLKGQLLFNNLNLTEAYDRSLMAKDPSILKHTNSYGELQVFMEDVHYTVEGRYTMKKDRLAIELIVSTLDTKFITLTHSNANKTDPPIWLDKQNMGDFMLRLKADLDKWVQDYFNEYLTVTNLENVPSILKLREYDQHKGGQLAKFVDNALIRMNNKLHNIVGDTVRIPNFKITASHNMSIWIHAGTLRGLDTMYRRSQATKILKKKKNILNVDTIIGFRDLKVLYAYEIQFPLSSQTAPTLNGLLIMSANQQTAHITLELLNKTKILELDIDFLNRMGADAITIEGAAKVVMKKFKYILHHEIATIMSNSIVHTTQLLKTLLICG
ncbi:unnamed protein product [Arctia plantaginis]|uniref:Uncharacterized protein n=1 Tax=Arctia plantaginis TaxID=874455 RepID=A0A8S0Z5T6_ARCPL|nr:unnamed protein product [Arctia plantaginis]